MNEPARSDPPAASEYAELEGMVDTERSFSAKLCFAAIETTGPDPEHHEVWELAVIVGEDEYRRFLDVTAARADPATLREGRFYQRHPAHAPLPTSGGDWQEPDTLRVAQEVARMTAGAHLIAANPARCSAFLGAFLRLSEAVPAWQSQLVDVIALAAGRLRLMPPWEVRELSLRLGVRPLEDDDRTAIAEARWARQIFAAALD